MYYHQNERRRAVVKVVGNEAPRVLPPYIEKKVATNILNKKDQILSLHLERQLLRLKCRNLSYRVLIHGPTRRSLCQTQLGHCSSQLLGQMDVWPLERTPESVASRKTSIHPP